MSDFRTVLIKDSRLADITDHQTFAVMSGASNNTYQQFSAVTTSASNIVFNIQIPSESIVINREILLSSQLTFTLRISDVPALSTAFNLGVTDSMQAFPLNSLFTTLSATINNTNVSINLQDVLPSLLRLNNSRELYAYNGMTPTLPDQAYLNYSDAVLANNNPLASWNTQSYDVDLAPRGSFPVNAVISQYTSGGVFVSNSPTCATAGNYFLVEISSIFTEPLFLSPFIYGNPEFNCGGICGVNTMNFVMNIDATCKRLFSTANPYTYAISLGTASNANPFTNTRMLLNFLSTQPTDLIPSRNVLPFYDFPRYLSLASNNQSFAPQTSATITSQNIQLNQLPDYFFITVRIPMSQQTIKNSSSFFTINSISVNLNNQSGLLSSSSTFDLWRISKNNNSTQSWQEFSGQALVNANSTGVGATTYTTGSLLILSPAKDLSLPSYLSSSSIGQFNFQFNINVTNHYSATITPEICVICCNSGLFVTQAGSSVITTGVLTKQMVLDAQEQKSVDPISSAEYTRMIGGKMHHMSGSVLQKMVNRLQGKRTIGGAMSAGAMSGGGVRAPDKLSKYY